MFFKSFYGSEFETPWTWILGIERKRVLCVFCAAWSEWRCQAVMVLWRRHQTVLNYILKVIARLTLRFILRGYFLFQVQFEFITTLSVFGSSSMSVSHWEILCVSSKLNYEKITIYMYKLLISCRVIQFGEILSKFCI